MSRTVHRVCPLCEACCGLEITVEGPKVVAIRGHAADTFSHGYVCPKAVALKDLHEDPDRLRQPLVRRHGELQPATWDEAFAEIAARLPAIQAAHGHDAVALSLGNPIVHKAALNLYVPRLAKALRTKNVYSASTLDQMPKQLASGWMYGHWLSVALPDITRTQHLLVIGANPLASNGSMWTVPDFRGKAKALRERGGKLVVIDPRRTETAAVADEHHAIRPGADVFLLAAMAQTLFAEGLVRLGPAAPHLAGVDAVREAVAPFTPERVAERCGIAAGEIRRLARELAAAPRAAVYARIGTTTQAFGTTASWLVDVLNALTGNLDREGGVLFTEAAGFAANTRGAPGRGAGITVGRHRSRVSGAPEVMGELPMGVLAEEIETPGAGQVRALVTIASNPVLSAPDGERLALALDTLDFMVSVDIYLNETTRHADVVLPGLSPLEDSHYDPAFAQLAWRNHARYSPAVLERVPGALPEWQVLLRLIAIAQGQGAQADPLALDDALVADEVRRLAGAHADAVLAALAGRRGPERWIDLALRAGPYGDAFGLKPGGLSLARLADAPAGIDLGELKPRLPAMLRTPSGKVELAPEALLADLPRALADLATPAPALAIIGRRDVRSNNSWMHNLPTLAKGPERCTLLMHPDDAAAHGLADGALARIARGARAVTARVECSPALMRGVVSLPHGWGHDLPGAQLTVAAQRPGANLNALFSNDERDPLSGTSVLSGQAVTVSPARNVGPQLAALAAPEGHSVPFGRPCRH